MTDPVAMAGGDRAVARALSTVAAAAPVRPAPPTGTPARDAQRLSTPADIAATGGLAAQLAARPPVDAERVQQIKKAIANGTFPILPATIADRLLAVRYEWMSNDRQA